VSAYKSRHHIFLSYSRQDSEFVFSLHDQLEKEGLDVWIDREGIKPGTSSWRKTIQDAIDQASCLLVVLSPDAKESHWVGEELNYAQTQGKWIFYVLARGDERTAVPFGHSTAQWVDMRGQQNFDPCLKQLTSAIFDYLRIDRDIFKRERLRIEEARRRKEHEQRERHARQEAQRLAEENASPLPPQFVAPPLADHDAFYETPSPVSSRAGLLSSQGVPGRLYQPVRAVEVAGVADRLVAAAIDNGIFAITGVSLSEFFEQYIAFGIVFAIWFSYHVVGLVVFNGQTLGKKVMGIRVVAMSGEPILFGPAVARMMGYYLESLVLGIGLLLAFTNRDRRTLHDFLASTRVVKA